MTKGLAVARAIGIDLGSTNSVVCAIAAREPTVIVNGEGSRTTPSVVAFTREGEVLAGEAARRQALTNPDRTIRAVKRRMGTDWSVDIDGRTYLPQEISARLLMKLKRDAEAYLGEVVTDAVIAVPAYFDDAQRTATREAAEIADLNVLRIVNEPTVAALAYGLGTDAEEQTVLIFDLGGGHLTVEVPAIGEGVVEVLSISGDHIGGDDWDERIVGHLVKTFHRRHGIDLPQDPIAMPRLREAAENAKIELSAATVARVNLPYLATGPAGPLALDVSLSRTENVSPSRTRRWVRRSRVSPPSEPAFETMTQDLLDRCQARFQQAIKYANIPLSHIEQVVLVGGSSRMPAVSQLVKKLTGKEPNRGVNPDEVVATGAAWQAGVLRGEVGDVLYLDVTSFSLGIETEDGTFTKLIHRNTSFPAIRSAMFTTVDDNQRSVLIQVLQGEHEIAALNRRVGTFKLTDLLPAPRGVPQIEVTFDIDADGITHVSARDLATAAGRSITVTGGSALPKDELDRMRREAHG